MAMSVSEAAKHLSQFKIYQRLRTSGSPWLKAHVLYANDKVVVLNKPPELVCQLNNSGDKFRVTHGSTFLNVVFEDDDGCFLVPTTHSSAKSLSTQFRNGDVKKSYLALVRGDKLSFASTGEINEPILYTHGFSEIHPDGKVSKTRWKVLGSSPKAPISLLQLDLITGNKHQLRIHLSKVLRGQ
ncbi:pseudouridine synthase [Pholiota molesta]|nr:pseudouridine synthase [Pholiota molesta]